MEQYVSYVVQGIVVVGMGYIVKYYMDKIQKTLDSDIVSLKQEVDVRRQAEARLEAEIIRLQEHIKDSSEILKIRLEISEKFVSHKTFSSAIQLVTDSTDKLNNKIEEMDHKLFSMARRD